MWATFYCMNDVFNILDDNNCKAKILPEVKTITLLTSLDSASYIELSWFCYIISNIEVNIISLSP